MGFLREKVFVMHVITGLNDGGAEGVLYRICTHDTGCRHYVISLMGEGKYGPLLRQNGIELTCLNMSQGRLTLSGLWGLWRLICRERPTVVQTWMYHADLIGGVIALLAGVRHVFWGIRHTTLDDRHSRRSTIWVAKLCAWLSPTVPNGIICCAQNALRVHHDLGYNAKKMRVIYNGYNIQKFFPDINARERLRANWGISNTRLVGMVGRFNPQKDHQNLIAALSKVKERGFGFRLVLVGQGMEWGNHKLAEWLKSHALEDEAILLGPRRDIPEVMSALDIHVLSSAFGEAFPNVIAEAMACGTPCITTDVGDAAMIVGDTGWVVPPCDAVALAVAIESALIEPQTSRQARGIAARSRIAEKFSLSRMIEEYHKLWRTEQSLSII